MTDKSETGFSISAKQFQGLVMVVLVAVCAWVGDTLNRLNITVATQTETIATMKEQMRQDEVNRYTSSDADKDFRLRDEMLASLNVRMTRLEGANHPVELRR